MVKFLKPNKAVIILQGRYAGRKGVIVKSFDDGTRDRPYGHCLVAGISKYPKKVIRKDSAKKQAKKSRVKCFLKLVNYKHIMPTRYTLDVDLKDIVAVDSLQAKGKKVTAAKEVKASLKNVSRPVHPTTNKFQRLFIAYDACIKRFNHCRPLLCLDEAHLKAATVDIS